MRIGNFLGKLAEKIDRKIYEAKAWVDAPDETPFSETPAGMLSRFESLCWEGNLLMAKALLEKINKEAYCTDESLQAQIMYSNLVNDVKESRNLLSRDLHRFDIIEDEFNHTSIYMDKTIHNTGKRPPVSYAYIEFDGKNYYLRLKCYLPDTEKNEIAYIYGINGKPEVTDFNKYDSDKIIGSYRCRGNDTNYATVTIRRTRFIYDGAMNGKLGIRACDRNMSELGTDYCSPEELRQIKFVCEAYKHLKLVAANKYREI